MKIAIIGAGLAGVEAAVAAKNAGATSVTIFSREAHLPYMRPRLPEIAFGSGDPSRIAMHPAEWYAEKGISLKLDTPVTSFEVGDMLMIKTPDGEEIADALVLAGGATPLKPVIPGLVSSTAVFTLWSADDARRISSYIRRIRSVAILGGGILGVESAIRARKAGLKVHLIERQSRVMPLQFDDAPSAAIAKTLEDLGIKLHLGASVDSAEEIGSKLGLHLSKEQKTLDVDMVVLAVGARPGIAVAQASGLTCDHGIIVDETLQTTCPQIYAAGDCIQYGGQTRNCALAAITQGRVAGYNAVVSTGVGTFKSCPADEIPLLYKGSDLELHSWGQTAATCASAKFERLDDGKDPKVVRAKVVRSDGTLVGVQMVGTGEGFDALVKKRRPA
ncbi:MAG: FAD-dependent oxidoreductase [Kiritimatiellae bacterium]|nr:FAD-dependent oxidoreductase [Kiritimatiellia bacterium]